MIEIEAMLFIQLFVVLATPLPSNTTEAVNHGTTASKALQTSSDQLRSVAATRGQQTNLTNVLDGKFSNIKFL